MEKRDYKYTKTVLKNLIAEENEYKESTAS